jgi:hypothetical protein
MGIGRQDRIAIVLPNGQTATTPSSAGRVLRKLATAENFMAARRRGGRVAARIAHEMKDLDAKQTILQGIMFVLQ